MAQTRARGQQFWKYVRDYLTVHLPKIRGLSAHTVDSYGQSIRSFCVFLEEHRQVRFSNVSFDHLTRDSVTRYIHWLGTRKCGITTCNLRLSALKSLLRYCADEDISLQSVYQEVNNIPSRKAPRTLVGYLSKDALTELLAQPDIATMKGRRNRMIVILLYDTGTRVQELVDMKVSDVYLQTKTPFVIVTGKGRKPRSIPLMAKTVVHLQEYLRQFHVGSTASDDRALFYSMRAGRPHRLSTDAISVLLKNYGERARRTCSDVPHRVHPHLLRHTRAMHLYQSGMPLPYIAEFLGHASVTTTEIYASADIEMLRKALEQADSGLADETPAWKDEDNLRKLCGL